MDNDEGDRTVGMDNYKVFHKEENFPGFKAAKLDGVSQHIFPHVLYEQFIQDDM